MKRIISLVFALMIMAFIPTVHAENKAESVSFTFFAGGYFFEGNENFKDKPIYGLRAGYNFNEHWGVEGLVHYLRGETKTPGDYSDDWNRYGAHLEGLYHFMPEGRFVPFIAAGIGAIHEGNTYHKPEPNRTSVDYGVGLKYFLTKNVALRADVRHFINMRSIDDRYNDLLATLGIHLAFGGKEEVKIEKQPEQEIPDSDKDGVPDNMDRCPDTPANWIVGKDGCIADYDKDGIANNFDKCPDTPSGIAVNQDGCPPDSDRDKVYDYLDMCPDTPAGMSVDEVGCPPDSDNDGVPDYLDKCPNTPEDKAVEKDGCVHSKVSILLKVEFDSGKSVIRKKYHNDIKSVADFLKKHPGARATIAGHTDNIGKPKTNLELSKVRAESVRQYLIDKFGIDGSRITTVGYGDEKPVTGNDTEKGRQKNRRIVTVIESIEKN